MFPRDSHMDLLALRKWPESGVGFASEDANARTEAHMKTNSSKKTQETARTALSVTANLCSDSLWPRIAMTDITICCNMEQTLKYEE